MFNSTGQNILPIRRFNSSTFAILALNVLSLAMSNMTTIFAKNRTYTSSSLSLFNQSNISPRLFNETRDIPILNDDSKYCGYLSTSNGTSVNVTEGKKIDQILFQKIRLKFNKGSIILTKDECKIEICGFSSRANLAYMEGVCENYFETESPVDDLPKFYEITAISCGCKKPNRPLCGDKLCTSNRMDDFVKEDPEICGVLYQEKNCQDCFYDAIRLTNDGVFQTKNSAAIKSLLVRPGCYFELRTFGYLWIREPWTKNIKNNTGDVQPSFFEHGEEFYCRCDPKITPTIKTITTSTSRPATNGTAISSRVLSKVTVKPIEMQSENQTIGNEAETKEGSVMTIVMGSTGAFFGVGGIITLILAVYILKLKRPRNKLHQPIVLTKEEIRNFKEGLKNKSNSIEMQDLSSGHSQAFVLRYDVKFELNRDTIRINPDDPKSIIGEGEFGIVYKGMFVSLDDNRFQEVAVKTVRAGWKKKAVTVKALLNEIKVLSYLGYHPNIVYFVGACTVNLEKGEVFLVLKLCHGGSLKDYLKEESYGLEQLVENSQIVKENECISSSDDDEDLINYSKERTRIAVPVACLKKEIPQELFNLLVKWSEEIATGMEFLTTKNVIKNVVHIDLAARNVLLTDDLTAKISDFGLSRKLYDKIDYEKEGKEPIPIKGVALESLTAKTYSKKSDVWGYGVTTWEIFSLGEDPYEQMSPLEIFSTLANGRRLPRPKYSSLEIYEEMLKCWNEDPDARPSFTDLIKFFRNLRENFVREVVDS